MDLMVLVTCSLESAPAASLFKRLCCAPQEFSDISSGTVLGFLRTSFAADFSGVATLVKASVFSSTSTVRYTTAGGSDDTAPRNFTRNAMS
eukprot:Skav200755  [mRNA]  locus=scaffold1117:465446:473901:- [translate_table: standard]